MAQEINGKKITELDTGTLDSLRSNGVTVVSVPNVDTYQVRLSDWAQVSLTGSYNDLSDKPDAIESLTDDDISNITDGDL